MQKGFLLLRLLQLRFGVQAPRLMPSYPLWIWSLPCVDPDRYLFFGVELTGHRTHDKEDTA